MIQAIIKAGEKDSTIIELKNNLLIGIYHPRGLIGTSLDLMISHDGVEFSYLFLDFSRTSRAFHLLCTVNSSINWAEFFPEILRRKLDGINFIKFRAYDDQNENIQLNLITESCG